ncbi:MAG: AEC family transporter [Limosilactobacillus gorillae]|jgi:malate permease and related proteins|uniref:AEC family transporter n=1 Tax=Limosilactobacillus gorillae TaxID=1450649 RepID=UPI000ADAAE67|nr:AEC family transporter [Limosilactobacillus gorillae]MDO4855185.1 AEC family transporter [Limosilactobacillus gorillae]
MAVFWTSIQSVLSIIIMMAIGYICKGRGWFDESFSKALSQIIMKVALPCSIFISMLDRFKISQLKSLSVGLIYTIIAFAIGFAISWLIVSVFRVPANQRGLMIIGINGANTVFIGLPLNIALFGNVSIPYLLVYYIVNTIVIWTFGVWIIAAYDPTTKGKVSIDWKHFLPAPLWGFIVAIPFLIWMPNASTQLPTFITTTLTDIGALVTPLSLIYIGIMLKDFGIKSVHFGKSLNLAIFGRFIISPIIMFAIIYVGAHGIHIHMTDMFSKTLIIQSATPTFAVLPILADQYHSDVKFATSLVVATSCLFVIVVPIIMGLLSL